MTAQISLFDELIVDNFAGGGGASTGIELATGRVVDYAINHDPDAIRMHTVNHPHTIHLQASVWDVDPVELCRGRPVGLAWFSPDCKHFSKAKGAALVEIEETHEERTETHSERTETQQQSEERNLRYLGNYKVTGYDICVSCCGSTKGITASGTTATVGRTCAAPKDIPFGTRLWIEGIGERVVEDRGGAVNGKKIDVLCVDHPACYAITGTYEVYIISEEAE